MKSEPLRRANVERTRQNLKSPEKFTKLANLGYMRPGLKNRYRNQALVDLGIIKLQGLYEKATAVFLVTPKTVLSGH